MKKITLTLSVICALLFFAINSKAQTQITLQDALEYALKNSVIINQAKLDIEDAHQKVRENQANVYPQLSVVSSLTGNPVVQQFVLPAEAFGGPAGQFMSIKVGQNWSAYSQVRLSQQVFNQQVFTGLKAAKSAIELFELINDVSRENVIQLVATTYFQVLITEEKLNVIDANIKRMESLETMMQGQFDVGLVKSIDLDRIKVNKSNINTQKLSLLNAITQQKNLLKYYMGMPMSEVIALSSSIDDFIINTSVIDNSDTSSVKNLTTYRVLEKQEELLGLKKDAQQAEAYPSLFLDAHYTYNTQSDDFNLYTGNALNFDMSSINLTLSIPIFDGFARHSKVSQTEIEKLKVEEDKRQTMNELIMSAQNSSAQMRISLININNQKENVSLAEDVFNSTQNNYQNGLAPLTDLLDAETDLVTAQNGYHEALINFKIAEIEYLKSQGKINSLLDN